MFKKISGLFCILGVLFLAGLLGEWETHYSMLAYCDDVDYTTEIATFVDNSGNVWEWELDLDSWFIKEGHVYRLCMSNNHSTMIYDDYIRKIKEN